MCGCEGQTGEGEGMGTVVDWRQAEMRERGQKDTVGGLRLEAKATGILIRSDGCVRTSGPYVGLDWEAKGSTNSVGGATIRRISNPNLVNLGCLYELEQMGFRYTCSNQLGRAPDIRRQVQAAVGGAEVTK
jgi:hypothetical protein